MLAESVSAASGAPWLAWLSPIGWANVIRAYAGEPLAGARAAGAGRDGADRRSRPCWPPGAISARGWCRPGLAPPRPPPGCAARSPWPGGCSAAAWSAGPQAPCSPARPFGSVADGIGSLLGSGAQVRDALTRLGGQAGITDAYLAAMMGVIGLAAAAYAVSAVLRLRAEETVGPRRSGAGHRHRPGRLGGQPPRCSPRPGRPWC